MKRRRHEALCTSAWLTLAFLLISTDVTAGESAPTKTPRLVLLLVVDQMRADYLDRLGPHFAGGFQQLMTESVTFTDAHHAHAITNTAPGHATITTGAHPRRHGIIDNWWFDRATGKEIVSVLDEDAPLLEHDGKRGSAGGGRSPQRLLVDGLPDWLIARDPESRAISVGGKDRSVVLLGGKKPTGAYWLDVDHGVFTTSTYYRSSWPTWLTELNDRKLADALFATIWEPLPVDSDVESSFGLIRNETGAFSFGFPHRLGHRSSMRDKHFYRDVASSPFIDTLILELAAAALEHESLGRDAHTDYLAVSFPALDSVGHGYGPNSPEALDTLLRLDVVLGRLLGLVEAQVGLDHTVILLTSDHGVQPFPESGLAESTRRAGALDIQCLQQAGKDLAAKLGDEEWQRWDGYLHYELIGRKNQRRQDVEDLLGGLLTRCDAIARVWTRTELEAIAEEDSPAVAAALDHQRMYWRSFHPVRSPDIIIQHVEGWLKSLEFGTGHGSPYRYDTHVPMLLRVPGVAARAISVPVQTVDIAPTLAGLCAVRTPEDLDGVDRSGLLVGLNRLR